MKDSPDFVNLKEVANVLSESMKWIFSRQNKDGGVPPYPEEGSPNVKDSGVLASSDSLSAILRPFASPDKKVSLPEYLSQWDTVKIGALDGRRLALRERIVKLSSFLVDAQQESGGFPPLGDVYWIKLPFTDATASVILALLSVYRVVDQLYPDSKERAEQDRVRISDSVGKGIKWLMDIVKKDKNSILYWPSDEKDPEVDVQKIRSFPVILSAVALNFYKDLYRDDLLLEKAKTADIKQVQNYLHQITEYLQKRLELQKYIGLRYKNADDISFVNTTLAINFLLEFYRDPVAQPSLIRIINESFSQLIEEWREIEKNGGAETYFDIDLDVIDLRHLQTLDPSLPSEYGATYARRPSILFAGLNIWEKLQSKSKSKEQLSEFVQNEIVALLNELSKRTYYYEFRGELTPAVSSTATSISCLRKFLEMKHHSYLIS